MASGHFRFLHKRRALIGSPKILHGWLRLRPLSYNTKLVQIRSRGESMWWVKWNHFLYLCPFIFGNSPTNETDRKIFTLDGSNKSDCWDKSKMADGRHREKSKNCDISATDWPNQSWCTTIILTSRPISANADGPHDAASRKIDHSCCTPSEITRQQAL